MLTEKLIRDAKFHAIVLSVQYPQRADPGVEDLGWEPALQSLEEPLVNVIAHGTPSYGVELRTHLSTAVDNSGSHAVIASPHRNCLRDSASRARAPDAGTRPEPGGHHSTGV